MKRQKIIYLGLSGVSGRMGKAVKQLVKEKNSGIIISAVAPPATYLEKWANKTIDGVIDFSSPEII